MKFVQRWPNEHRLQAKAWNGNRAWKYWTTTEAAILRREIQTKYYGYAMRVAEQINRTPQSVRTLAGRMGLTRKKHGQGL